MFGPLTLVVEKASIIALIGLAAGSCAWFLIKNAFEQLIINFKTGKIKNLILITTGVALLCMSMVIILESELVTKMLSDKIHPMAVRFFEKIAVIQK